MPTSEDAIALWAGVTDVTPVHAEPPHGDRLINCRTHGTVAANSARCLLPRSGEVMILGYRSSHSMDMIHGLAITIAVCSAGCGLAAEILETRIARLPAAMAADWQAYLARSRAAAEHNQERLAAEIAAAGWGRAIRAPSGGDFKPRSDTPPNWYCNGEGATLIATVLSFQTPAGGWSKHTGYSRGQRQPGMQWSSQSEPGRRSHYLGTIDNGATTRELRFLAQAWAATGRDDCRVAVSRGLDYLLAAQFPSGGWPQVYPLEGGYHDNITFNDDAMTNVLELLQDIIAEKSPFRCVEPDRRARIVAAVKRGIACVLASQIKVRGVKAVWCSQHDPLSFAAVPGRAYEPAALSGVESARLLRFLMRLPQPSPEVVACIESGLAWLEAAKVTGLIQVTHGGRTTLFPPIFGAGLLGTVL